MATTIIRSTDAAAVAAGAILTGNAGSLVAVLDHALVTRLGWTKDFSAANKGVYRAPSGVRHYLDVDDSGPDATALGRNARLRGYEAATAVGAGTGPFPTTTQVPTCVYVKSTATGTTARPWIIIGDDRTFYLFSEAGGTDPPNLALHTWTDAFFFGEVFSALTGDLYRTILAHPASASATVTAAFLSGVPSAVTSVISSFYTMPRSYTGTGGPEWVTPITTPFFQSGQLYTTQTGVVFPNSADGGLYLNAALVGGRGSGSAPSTTAYVRGRLRGLYLPAHFISSLNDQDTFSGVGDFAGKTFIALQVAGTRGQGIAFETGTWAAST